jgi:hypothetical protein
MRFVREVEIKSIVPFVYRDGFLFGIVLQDELFKEHESPLVGNLLPNLDLCNPDVRCEGLFAVFALLVYNYILNYKTLLKHSLVLNFFLHSNLDFEPLGMWLGPQEDGVY